MSPHIPATLMAWLKTNYPPRCRKPGETELDHERYAGRVDLVAELEEHFKDQSAPDVTSPELLGGLTFDEAYGEKE